MAVSLLRACPSCDPILRERLFDDSFGPTFLKVVPPLLVGGAIVVSLAYARARATDRAATTKGAPLVAAGTLLGLGMGGFLDGILLHQVLQWHQMLSNQLTPDTLLTKNVNMFWDGVFHLGTWAFTALGIGALWHVAKRDDVVRSTPVLAGAALFGWGAFNILDSVANHYGFKLHNVREVTDSPAAWNAGFLLVGILQVLVGWWVVSPKRRAEARAAEVPKSGPLRPQHQP
jgi:uncharacterized membrane protein